MAARLETRTSEQLDRAADCCAAQGGRLTEIRRSVLGLVIEAGRPVGAYTLLDRLKAERANAAPVTVYRALEFLQANGLIHKVERLNAFVACTEQGERHHHEHSVQFLICRKCGTVAEMEDTGIARAVSRAAGQTGFHPDHATVEVEGTCGNCATPGRTGVPSEPPGQAR
jgi:Fur family zinc uptake transcriptional regulator